MKVILLTSDYNLPANVAIRDFLENPTLKKQKIDIVGLVSASTFDFNERGFRVMMKFIKKSGFWFFAKSIFSSIWKRLSIGFAKWFIPDSSRTYFSLQELAEKHNIPFLSVEDVNSKTSEAFIKDKKPDYLTSLFLLQILKKNILKLPHKGAINAHPALMQRHRGVFTSFWALLKNWRHGGATVHFMTEKVDEGKVILQKRFFVHPSDTIYSVNYKSAKICSQLILKALLKLKRNEKYGFFLKKAGRFFTMPSEKDIQMFYQKGRSLMTVREFFRI